jgi:hypothetical protein
MPAFVKESFRFLLFAAVLFVPTIAAAQRERPTGQSIISGRVLFADTGRPVRRATVQLRSTLNHPPVRSTPTNYRGEFRFTEVAPGSYFVVAVSPGIVSSLSSFAITEFGLANYNDAEQTRVTADGKNTSRCEVRVVRAGTIKGTIFYSDKEPVVNGRVVVFRRKGGTVVPYFTDPVITNDRGMYRINGLPDGEYFVAVVVGQYSAQPVELLQRTMGLPSSYYPGVRSLAEAKPVQNQSGTEVTGINIIVGDEDLRRISGVLKWRHSGERVTRGSVGLRRKNDPTSDFSLTSMFRAITPAGANRNEFMMRDMMLISLALPPLAEVNDKGEWYFDELPPGTYILTAYASLAKKKPSSKAEPEIDAEPGDPDDVFDQSRYAQKQIELTVDQEDQNGVTIEMTEGARILGLVTMSDGSAPPRVPISVEMDHRTEFLLSLPRFSKPDGSFLVEGVSAGEVRFDVELSGPDDSYLASITHGGQDLMREPLRVTEGAEIAGVRVTLEKGLATLTGRVQWKEDASPVAGAGVLLVKADPRLWHLRSSRRFESADSSGAFVLKCPPGDYLAITWPIGGQPLEAIEDFLRAHAATAQRISLRSKEEKQIEFTLNRPRK